MKRISFFLTFALVLMLGMTAFGQDCTVSIAGITNDYAGGTQLNAGKSHVMTLHVTALCSPGGTYNTANGIKIYTPDGADFGPVQGAALPAWDAMNWTSNFKNHFEWNGTAYVPAAAGTAGPAVGENVAVSFSGVSFNPAFGLPAGLNADLWTMSFSTLKADAGKHICIDSTFTPPGGVWKWASLAGNPDVYADWYAAPVCLELFDVPDPAPEFTNCTNPPAFSHCATATYDFNATDEDAEGNPNTALTFALVSGPGAINATTGMWSFNTPPQEDNLTLVVSVSDGVNAPVECTVELSFTNQGPTITCPAGPVTISTGDTKTQTVVTNDDCDALTVSVISAIDPGDVVNVVGNAISYTPAGDARLVTMTVEVSDGLETATCDITWDVITTAPYIVQIEKDEGPDGIGAIQGQFTDVTVTLNSFLASSGDDVYGVGAFDLLIAYDQSVLGFQQAIEGDIYDDCGWEYFTYRFGPDGNCGNACPSGMTRVVGIAETNNGPYHPGCLPDYVDVAPKDLFDLRFLVSNDRTFECQYAPVRFFWIDCGDNTLSNADGTELYISSKVFDFDNAIPVNNGTIGFPTFQGAQDICLIAEVQKDPPIRNIDFINGGVDIACADSIDARGDINLNGLAYEIADAVMFTNYFISGLGAFEYVDGSIAASDANADGIPLSVADLVYLIRVVIGDALPYPKVNPTVAKYTVENNVVNSEIELGAALIVLEGNASFENLTDLEMVTGIVDGNRHVLLYSTEANATATGALLSTDGAVLKLEGATYEGQPVNFDLVPGSFRVEQNYPNPFNPTTIITFQAPGVSEATVTIYNAIGQKVDQMTVQTSNGFGEVSWDASDMSSGIYFYKVVAGQYTATKKAILLK